MIIFSNVKARNQLLNKGEVITIRQYQRGVGRGWATNKRGGSKIADVHITFIREFDGGKPVTPADLAPYLEKTGFGSAAEWLQAASYYFDKPKTYNKIYRAYLYHVAKLRNGHIRGTPE
jgi:hypothetical protein